MLKTGLHKNLDKSKIIVQKFKELGNKAETAKFLNISKDSVRYFLKKEGEYGPDTKTKRNHIEKFPQDDYLLGYVCGLVATDGCLNKNSNQIVIGFKSRDKEILEYMYKHLLDIDNFIDPTPKLTYRKDKDFYSLSLNVPKLYSFCLDFGITPNKSKTLTVNLGGKSNEFKWSFLRGVIDGDGTVHYSDVPYKTGKSVTIYSGSLHFINDLFNAFGGRIASYPITTSFGETISHRLIFSGEDLKYLINNLPDLEFSMERKTKKLNLIKNKI